MCFKPFYKMIELVELVLVNMPVEILQWLSLEYFHIKVLHQVLVNFMITNETSKN